MEIQETQFSRRVQQREKEMELEDSDLVRLTRSQLYDRLKRVMGNNPLREIDLRNGNTLLQMDETIGPSESHYDRVFVHLIEALENDGKIAVDSDVLETSTGSAGISFGWVAQKLGFRPHVFMPSYVPEPRVLETQRFTQKGGLHLIDNREQYIQACSEAMVAYFRANKANNSREGRKTWMANHSQDPRVLTYFSTIADELSNFARSSSVDYFIGGVGNGSTLLGIGRRLKEHFPNSTVIGFEPHRASPYYQAHRARWGNFTVPILGEGEHIHTHWSFHDMPGTGSFGNIKFPFLDAAIQNKILDDIVPVDERHILSKAPYNHELPPEQQFGHSTLVARYIAEKMALDVSNKTFFTLAYDKADRYGKPRFVDSV